MIYNYGYQDGSGEYYITIDGEKCSACRKCIEVCPHGVLELWIDDDDKLIAKVADIASKKISYICTACRSVSAPSLHPCNQVCEPAALVHSW